MTRAEAAAEFGSILRLLREHAFLRYSGAGAREYEDKLRSASGLFAELARRATGVAVPNPFPHSGLESASRGDFPGLVGLAKRCSARLAAAAKAGGEESAALAAASAAWRRAAELLSALSP